MGPIVFDNPFDKVKSEYIMRHILKPTTRKYRKYRKAERQNRRLGRLHNGRK